MNSNFSKRWFLISGMFLALLITPGFTSGQSANQGPLNPSVILEQYGGCLACPGASWTNPMEAMLADSQYARTQLSAFPLCFQGSCYYSRALMSSGFGFNIPVNATITGIVAEVLRKADLPQYITDTIVQLMDAGQPVGANLASLNTWGTSAQYQPYGDSTQLWGTAWTPAQINDPGFGLYFMPRNKDMSSSSFLPADVDHIRMKVYYQVPTGIPVVAQPNSPLTVVYDQATESILVQSDLSTAEELVLNVYDASGKSFYAGKMFSYNGHASQQQLSAGTYPGGIYIVELISGNRRFEKKIRITK